MKFLLLPLGFLLSLLVAHAASFEGTVKMTMTNGGTTHPITYEMKGSRVRTDVELGQGHNASAILDRDHDQMIMLMPAQHMYMVMPMRNAAAASGHDSDDVKIEKTSETQKILGYNCTKYVVTSKDTKTDVWATDELGTFMGLGAVGNPMGGRRAASAPWEQALTGKNFFPLRVVSESGKSPFRLEVTEVKKGTIPDSAFEPPADFRKFDMSGFPGMGRAASGAHDDQ